MADERTDRDAWEAVMAMTRLRPETVSTEDMLWLARHTHEFLKKLDAEVVKRTEKAA